MTCIRLKHVKIRKPRKCFTCRKVLDKNSPAVVSTNADGGKAWDITLCEDCDTRWNNEHCIFDDDRVNEGDYVYPEGEI